MYPIGYTLIVHVSKTKEFDSWLKGLKDERAKSAILLRILRIQEKDLLGDFKRLAPNVYELRIHLKPGYRIYFTYRNNQLMLLIGGGTKRTQSRDIDKYKRIIKALNNDRNLNL